MDISKLDINHIELFGLAYSVAREVFDVEPIKATEKIQRKIRKWVNKTYVDGDDLPKKVLNFIDDSKSDSEFIKFLAECSKHIEEHGTWKKQLFEKVAIDFSEDVKKAFIHLFETMQYCEIVEKQEDKIIFTLDETYSYKRKLILHTSKENFIDNFDLIGFSDAQIVKEENGYKLICVAENYETETSVPIGIFFDQATTEIDVYRADHRDFDDNPWESLAFMASDILEKDYLGAKFFNQKEQNIIPLLKELRALSAWAPLCNEETPNFEILKQYMTKYNTSDLIPLVDKFAATDKEKPMHPLVLSRLTNKLNEATCESLWRELYELVADTQEGYADKILSYNQTKLNKIRLQIEKKFHTLGYEGRYPTFSKKGAIKGIRLEESYNQSYFVGAEKNVEHIIECREFFNCDVLNIQFICGTALLKKGESITDIYSCCFNKKGRRLFKKFCWDAEDTDVLEQFITIATKKAECTKLNKKEKELLGNGTVSWQYFVSMFIFAGGLFAVLMTTATFLILCLVTAILDGFSGILDMIKQMPWWLFFAISFVGFGGAMAIVDTKAKTK